MLWLNLPLWKMWVRQLGWWHSQLNGQIIQMLNEHFFCILYRVSLIPWICSYWWAQIVFEHVLVDLNPLMKGNLEDFPDLIGIICGHVLLMWIEVCLDLEYPIASTGSSSFSQQKDDILWYSTFDDTLTCEVTYSCRSCSMSWVNPL